MQPAAGDVCSSTKVHSAAGDGLSSAKAVLPEKIQPATGDGHSSIKVVLSKRKSSRPPATSVLALKLHYQ